LSAHAPDPPTGNEVPGSVAAGHYLLELGSRDGAKLEALDEGTDPVALAQAIAQVEQQGTRTNGAVAPEREHGLVATSERELGVGAQVTSAIELARNLFVQIAQGRPPDVTTIDGAVEMLLGLLQRLDLDEHWEKAVRVARQLAMLLALLERWMELLQSLQTALHSAEKAESLGARAWALHEQGTLHLAAGNHARADRLLVEAHDLREQINDRSGLRVTDHNLQVLCKTLRAKLHGSSAPPPSTPRVWFPLRPVPTVLFAMLLLTLGGVAGAIVHGRGRPVRTVSVSGVSGHAISQGSHGAPVKGPTGGGTTGGSGAVKTVDVASVPNSVPGATATTEITVKALNADGELLPGQSVRFAVKPEDGTFSSRSAFTNAVGNAQVKLTFTSARTSAAVDTVEACTTTHVCGTVHVQWEARSTPIAATRAPSDVTSTGATLNGTLNPNGATVTSCFFEYGASTSYEHSVACASYKSSGISPEDVTAAVENLAPDTAYQFRLVADSTAGPGDGAPETFTASAAPVQQKPTVTTTGYSGLTSSSVSVDGSVNPNGSEVENCEFIYTPVRQQVTKTVIPSVVASRVECDDFRPGAGTSVLAVMAPLSNLAPGQPYHYQLVVTSAGVTYNGGPRSFETPAPLRISPNRPPIVPPRGPAIPGGNASETG
jgi:hypothetical protein